MQRTKMTITPISIKPKLYAGRRSVQIQADAASRSPALMHCSDEAARLLLKVSELASKELITTSTSHHQTPPRRTISFVLPSTDLLRCSVTPDSNSSTSLEEEYKQISKRSRTVSISSIDSMYQDAPQAVGLVSGCNEEDDSVRTPFFPDEDAHSTESCQHTFGRANKKKFVGTSTKDGIPVVAVLRLKFSWKSFPELEQFLIGHRAKYLQFSSEHNYTRNQKAYNNKLTQDLIVLATASGYVFEGFTFAAIRDRIR